MDLKEQIVLLGHKIEEENDAANDLWSWLPSHREAVKFHGDYAHEHRPSNADVMKEAAIVFGKLKHNELIIDGDPTEPFFQCPCQELEHTHSGEEPCPGSE